MDGCSTEVVYLIFLHACHDINGKTAQRLSLVCRGFRRIAKALEFRALSISGFHQLDLVMKRLKSDPEYSKGVRIEGLFICECRQNQTIRPSTQSAEKQYNSSKESFWSLAAEAIRLASPTVKALTLLAYCNDNCAFSYNCALGVLQCISGKNFPHLRNLTLRHPLVIRPKPFPTTYSSRWIPPFAPQLHTLHLVSDSYVAVRYDGRCEFHPLLTDMHTLYPSLRAVVLHNSGQMTDVRSLLNLLTRTKAEVNQAEKDVAIDKCLSSQVLPGKLEVVQVILRQSNDVKMLISCFDKFTQSVMASGIENITVSKPEDVFTKLGEREYEIMANEWEKNISRILII